MSTLKVDTIRPRSGTTITFGESGDTIAAGSGVTITGFGTTISNDANNRLTTADGSGGLNAEANMTFDGSTLTVTGAVVPGATDTYDLGASGNVWRNLYTGDLHLSNEAKSEGNAVDGTKGNWTIQEGQNDLYIINNKNGKKYKFNLTEIS